MFRWDALAQTIVTRTPLSDAEWPRSRVCIVDDAGRILADSSPHLDQLVFEFDGRDDFTGDIIHPQHWPENYDYSGKKVVVIGSGATARSALLAVTSRKVSSSAPCA